MGICILLVAGMIVGIPVGTPAQTLLVEDGRAQAVIVTRAEPLPVEEYAARELAYHVHRATGVMLETVAEHEVPHEPAGRVYVGDCEAARAAGIDPATLPLEGFALRATGGALFIVGEDTDGDPLHESTRAGTLWGVYELCEQALGVRWLWPGELGTHVPRATTVAVGALDETAAPRLLQRRLRSGLGLRPTGAGGFSPEAFRKYSHEQTVFLRRHRMGRSVPLRYGHAFERWWGLYGEAHPQWFQLVGGKRGPTSAGARFSMCVSEPSFHQHIVDLWKEARAADPDAFININLCENDIRGLCECDNCVAWDGPQPEDIHPRFGPRVVSDRYARFWAAVHELAAQEDPEAVVIAYAYVNYAPPPSADITLNDHIFVGTVPDLFFPRTANEQQWVKDQWEGWARTGARLFLRPNYTLEGYCMPHLFARQFADEFQHEAGRGMIATDFDSLTGQWSTQGPTLYLLARLHNRPEAPVDELLAEYYSAFGPAAGQVQAYFDYWEDFVTTDRERFREVARERGAGWSTYARMADALFPPEALAEGERLLEQAAQAAAEAPEAAARVEFLHKGLQHARLCAQFAAAMSGADADLSPVGWRRRQQDLLAFRAVVEMDGIANLNYCAWVEERSWRLTPGYDGEPLTAVSETVAAMEGAPVMPARGSHTWVALLTAGDVFGATVACQRIGASTAPAQWRLFGPDDRLIARGAVEVGERADIEAPATQDGVHLLAVESGGSVARVTLHNDHAALAGRTVHLLGPADPLFFHVPERTDAFTLTVRSPAPGETVRVRVIAPDGTEAAVGETGPAPTYVAELAVPQGLDGAWEVRFEKADTGVWEDYSLTLDERLAPYWAHAPDRLVR